MSLVFRRPGGPADVWTEFLCSPPPWQKDATLVCSDGRLAWNAVALAAWSQVAREALGDGAAACPECLAPAAFILLPDFDSASVLRVLAWSASGEVRLRSEEELSEARALLKCLGADAEVTVEALGREYSAVVTDADGAPFAATLPATVADPDGATVQESDETFVSVGLIPEGCLNVSTGEGNSDSFVDVEGDSGGSTAGLAPDVQNFAPAPAIASPKKVAQKRKRKSKNPAAGPSLFPCMRCDSVFGTLHHLKEHLSTQHFFWQILRLWGQHALGDPCPYCGVPPAPEGLEQEQVQVRRLAVVAHLGAYHDSVADYLAPEERRELMDMRKGKKKKKKAVLSSPSVEEENSTIQGKSEKNAMGVAEFLSLQHGAAVPVTSPILEGLPIAKKKRIESGDVPAPRVSIGIEDFLARPKAVSPEVPAERSPPEKEARRAVSETQVCAKKPAAGVSVLKKNLLKKQASESQASVERLAQSQEKLPAGKGEKESQSPEEESSPDKVRPESPGKKEKVEPEVMQKEDSSSKVKEERKVVKISFTKKRKSLRTVDVKSKAVDDVSSAQVKKAPNKDQEAISLRTVLAYFISLKPDCQTCSRGHFRSLSDLRDHLARQHYPQELREAYGAADGCSQCGQFVGKGKSQRLQDMSRHMAFAHGMLDGLIPEEGRRLLEASKGTWAKRTKKKRKGSFAAGMGAKKKRIKR